MVNDPYKDPTTVPTYTSMESTVDPGQMGMLQQMIAEAAALMSQMGSAQATRGSTAASSSTAPSQQPILRARRPREEADAMDIEQEIPDLPSWIEGCSKSEMAWRNLTIGVLHKRQRWSQRLQVAAHAAAMSR